MPGLEDLIMNYAAEQGLDPVTSEAEQEEPDLKYPYWEITFNDGAVVNLEVPGYIHPIDALNKGLYCLGNNIYVTAADVRIMAFVRAPEEEHKVLTPVVSASAPAVPTLL